MRLAGKVAVVTGASSGIGLATTRALAARGMRVVAVARRGDRLDALAATVPGVVPHPADVTDPAAVEALAARVSKDLGACHVLVNNAGVRGISPLRRPEDLPRFLEVVDLNLVAAARCMVAFAELLERSAPARVVNVASMAGRVAVGSPAYVTSKFALVGLTEVLRGDWADRDVAVCLVNPGFVETEGFSQDWLTRRPLGRRIVIAPEQVAEAIAEVARTGARERTVPRYYRLVTLARHLAAPAFFPLVGRLGRLHPRRTS